MDGAQGGSAQAIGVAGGGSKGVIVSRIGVSRIWRNAPWAMAIIMALSGLALFDGRAIAQDNLDAGKSPAQIFAATCSTCHHRPQEVSRASARFLRGHYTTGPAEASAMARYLASLPNTPRAADKKRQPPEAPAASRRKPRDEAKERPKEQAKEHPKEQGKGEPKASSASRKGRRSGASEKSADAAEEKPAVNASAAAAPAETAPPPQVAPAPPPPPAPPPFEE